MNVRVAPVHLYDRTFKQYRMLDIVIRRDQVVTQDELWRQEKARAEKKGCSLHRLRHNASSKPSQSIPFHPTPRPLRHSQEHGVAVPHKRPSSPPPDRIPALVADNAVSPRARSWENFYADPVLK